MALDAYRGDVIRLSPEATPQNPAFDVTTDCITLIAPADSGWGQVELSRPVDQLMGWSDRELASYGLRIDRKTGVAQFQSYLGGQPTRDRPVPLLFGSQVIGPPMTDWYAHLFEADQLPPSFDPDHFRVVIRERLRAVAARGVVRLIGLPATLDAWDRVVLNEAKKLGMEVREAMASVDLVLEGDGSPRTFWSTAVRRALTVGIDPADFQIQEGRLANFAAFQLEKGPVSIFHSHGYNLSFGLRDRVYSTWVDGRAVKWRGKLCSE